MERGRWDYTPIVTDSEQQTDYFAAVLAHCDVDGTTLTAVSATVEQANRLIRRKYRKHAKSRPNNHPVPDSALVGAGGKS